MSEKIETFVWQFNVTFACLFLLLSMVYGCAPSVDPPETFSIDSDFSPAEAAVIRDAVDAWCEAVGWCPEETDDAEARGRYVRSFVTGKEPGPGKNCPGYNDTWRVVIADQRGAWGGNLDMLWEIAAHETGHWCAVAGTGVDGMGHTESGLMAAEQREPVLTIDYRAIRAWQDGCR